MDINTAAERAHARLEGDLADAADRLTKDDLAYARSELIDKLLAGKTVDRMTIGSLIVSETQENERRTTDTLNALFSGLESVCGDNRTIRMEEFAQFARRLAEGYVDAHEDLILEHAEEIDAEARQDAEELAHRLGGGE